MTRIEFAPEVVADFDRIIDHLQRHEVPDAVARVQGIIEAINVLEHNPMIGRPVRGDLRELVTGRDTRGYVALYRAFPAAGIVLVLAIRSQREAGYAR